MKLRFALCCTIFVLAIHPIAVRGQSLRLARFLEADLVEAAKLPDDAFDEAIRQNPTDAKLFQSIDDFSIAIGLGPQHAVTYVARGLVWDSMEEYPRAIQDFERAFQIDPNDVDSIAPLSWFLATTPAIDFRNGNRAVELAMRACELTNWHDRKSLVALAAAFAEIGQFDSAQTTLQQAIELDPRNNRDDRDEMMAMFKAGKPHRHKAAGQPQ